MVKAKMCAHLGEARILGTAPWL